MNTTEDMVVEPTAKRIPNRYSLVVLAAKRARQIKEGAPPLIETDNPNALSVALDEIAAGKIDYIEAPEVLDDEAPHYEPARSAPSDPTAMDLLTDSLALAESEALVSGIEDTDMPADDTAVSPDVEADDETVIDDELSEPDDETEGEESPVQEEE